MRPLRFLFSFFCLLMCLAGCNNTAAAFTPTNTALPATPSPTPLATLAPSQVAAKCGAQFAKFNHSGYTDNYEPFGQISDLIVTRPELGFLSYPGKALPDGVPPDKPLQVDTLPQSLIPSNPYMGSSGSGLLFYLCNSSPRTSHMLQSMAITIASFIPDTSTNMNVEVGCDSFFNSKERSVGTGCGGSMGPCDTCYFLSTTWPATIAINTQRTMQTLDTSSLTFPSTIKASTTVQVFVGMDYPPSPGTFTFDFGAKIDGGAMVFANNPSFPLFLAKNAHKWSGLSCQDVKWSVQIPSTGIDHDFVCPATS
jgi:hypothetical protein